MAFSKKLYYHFFSPKNPKLPWRLLYLIWIINLATICVHLASHFHKKSKLREIEIQQIHRLANDKEVMLWETTMMKLIGEDGLGSVIEKIEFLKSQNKAFGEELNMIRKHINADECESTYDEVVRKFNKAK